MLENICCWVPKASSMNSIQYFKKELLTSGLSYTVNSFFWKNFARTLLGVCSCCHDEWCVIFFLLSTSLENCRKIFRTLPQLETSVVVLKNFLCNNDLPFYLPIFWPCLWNERWAEGRDGMQKGVDCSGSFYAVEDEIEILDFQFFVICYHTKKH